MRRSATPRAALLISLLPCACGEPSSETPPAGNGPGKSDLPSIVFIVTDDQGYADISHHGSGDIRTPNIDALADAGVRCTAGYVASPQCGPSRAGLITGQHPQRFGHEANPIASARASFGVPTRLPIMTEQLADAGYAVGMVGKWDLGERPFTQPWNRGVDYFVGFLGGARDYWPAPTDAELAVQLLRGPNPSDYIVQTDYLTHELTDAAVGFIDRVQQPFALVVSYNAPHYPFQVPPEYLLRNAHVEDLDRRIYAAMLTALDDGVGHIRAALARRQLLDNTLVVFVSDNGAPEPDSGPRLRGHTRGSNDPLRGFKGELYEGGLRVPYLVSWPGRLPSGTSYDEPVSTLDLLPTFLGAAGAEIPEALDGVDLLPYLAGDERKPPHEALYWRFDGHRAVRQGSLKWVAEFRQAARVYDLADDPAEEHDLAADRPQLERSLARAWARWNEGNVSPLWQRAPNIQLFLEPYSLDGMHQPRDPETGDFLPHPGAYRLRVASVDQCLAIDRDSMQAKAPATAVACEDAQSADWILERHDTAYSLTASHSDLCLTAATKGKRAVLQQERCNNSTDQRFRVLPAGGAHLLISEQTAECIDLREDEAGLHACVGTEIIAIVPTGN